MCVQSALPPIAYAEVVDLVLRMRPQRAIHHLVWGSDHMIIVLRLHVDAQQCWLGNRHLRAGKGFMFTMCQVKARCCGVPRSGAIEDSSRSRPPAICGQGGWHGWCWRE